jgi:phosphoglycolate phosphatase-like HAD superfamily hydrolase
LHRFYPGILEKLYQIQENASPDLFIVTAKAARFAKLLLEKQGIRLSEERIIGKECCRPKPQTLQMLIEQFDISPEQLWFVEDRLKTLQLV